MKYYLGSTSKVAYHFNTYKMSFNIRINKRLYGIFFKLPLRKLDIPYFMFEKTKLLQLTPYLYLDKSIFYVA